MTLYLPLANVPMVQLPSYMTRSLDPDLDLGMVLSTLRGARRIVVVCGAGISVEAGIPDFRSADGLFGSTQGRESFDAALVFQTGEAHANFLRRFAALYEKCNLAIPTPFHDALADWHGQGRLQRLYTQNIDGLEERCGIPVGISSVQCTKLTDPFLAAQVCVPLHGTVHKLVCPQCSAAFPMEDFVEWLRDGVAVSCPSCLETQEIRQAAGGLRRRPVGRLRPAVVLYSEEHPEGETIAQYMDEDVTKTMFPPRTGDSIDMLLVVGTSLHVPGVKRLVRDLASALQAHSGGPEIRRIFLNLSEPKGCPGVFDVWVHGDAQIFAKLLREEGK